MCGQKVTKKPHRGGTLSMGSRPYEPHPRDDTKGDICPPLESSLHCRKSDVRRKRPRRGRSEANQRSVCRGRRRRSAATEACRLRQDEGCEACADARPPLCRRGGEVHRGGTPSKGSLPYACFWLLFARAKSNSGSGAESPARFRKETCFFPSRPAIRESALHRPDAPAQSPREGERRLMPPHPPPFW